MNAIKKSIWVCLCIIGLNLWVAGAQAETAKIEAKPAPATPEVSTNIQPSVPDALPPSSVENLQPNAVEGPSAVESAEPVVIPQPVPAPTPAPEVIVHNKPYEVGFEKISAGDTAWMLSSTALVLLMTIPGLVLFYAGMVRKKNVLSTALQSFAICCLVSVIWVLIGYSLAFTPGSGPYIGGLNRLMLSGLSYIKATSQLSVSHIAPSIPESVFVMFQMTFAIITPALIVGAFS